MNLPTPQANPDARGLFALFPLSGFLAHSEIVAADQVPEPYHGLLVHEHHMTVTVEAFHKESVDVKVLEERRGLNAYARKILLVTQKNAAQDDPTTADIYSVGTIGTVLQLLKLPDGTVKVLVEGGQRALNPVSRQTKVGQDRLEHPAWIRDELLVPHREHRYRHLPR